MEHISADPALHFLPHGPQFRFIDRLISLVPGERGIAEYRVKGDEPFLEGHFPSNPIFPGVLLVEAAAQLAGVAAQSDPDKVPLKHLKLTAIKSVKITGTAQPGETIRLEAEVAGRLGGLIQANVRALVNHVLVMQGSLTLAGEE